MMHLINRLEKARSEINEILQELASDHACLGCTNLSVASSRIEAVERQIRHVIDMKEKEELGHDDEP